MKCKFKIIELFNEGELETCISDYPISDYGVNFIILPRSRYIRIDHNDFEGIFDKFLIENPPSTITIKLDNSLVSIEMLEKIDD